MSFEQQQVNQCIKLSETWKLTIEFFDDEDMTQPTDLTGRTPRVQVRTTPGAADPPLLDLTDGSGLTFTAAQGRIEINADTSPITNTGTFAWALELGGSENEEPIFGDFVVEQDTVR